MVYLTTRSKHEIKGMLLVSTFWNAIPQSLGGEWRGQRTLSFGLFFYYKQRPGREANSAHVGFTHS
jgi:hypothetical protein